MHISSEKYLHSQKSGKIVFFKKRKKVALDGERTRDLLLYFLNTLPLRHISAVAVNAVKTYNTISILIVHFTSDKKYICIAFYNAGVLVVNVEVVGLAPGILLMKKFLQTHPPIAKAIKFIPLYLHMFQPGSSSGALLQIYKFY
jgi:hypothetical protein